jgi:YqaJ-like viral recombinase domain
MSLTPEQAEIRRGFLTASCAAKIMGDLNTKGLSEYVRRLAGERLFGDLGEKGYESKWMERGSEEENPALDWFEFTQQIEIERQPFIRHPTLPTVACLPDGLCAGYTVEAKCPLFHVWAETREHWHRGLRGLQCVPSEYRWQARWQVWCAGTPEGRFVAYHPAGGGQGVVIPYTVDPADFESMAARVVVVEAMVQNWMEVLRPCAA